MSSLNTENIWRIDRAIVVVGFRFVFYQGCMRQYLMRTSRKGMWTALANSPPEVVFFPLVTTVVYTIHMPGICPSQRSNT